MQISDLPPKPGLSPKILQSACPGHNFDRMLRYLKYVFLAQGIYYVATGFWALVDIDSFMAVTGPKTDTWLVKALAFLFCAIGLVLILARSEQALLLPSVLAITTGVFMVCIDFYFYMKGVIPGVYLVDGVLHILFTTGVLICWAPVKKPSL
jgi:hypothetical protein